MQPVKKKTALKVASSMYKQKYRGRKQIEVLANLDDDYFKELEKAADLLEPLYFASLRLQLNKANFLDVSMFT